MANRPEDIRDSLIKGLRRLTLATIAIYLALVVVVLWVWSDASGRRRELERVAQTTNSALCELRADLERRVEASQTFLDENPNGIPGIPATAIKEGISNQRRTIDALSDLNCPSDEP